MGSTNENRNVMQKFGKKIIYTKKKSKSFLSKENLLLKPGLEIFINKLHLQFLKCMFAHLNIHEWFTSLHPLKGENDTRNRNKG